MIKDFLISFKDNFKNKTRNPFLGTYLIVWIIRNWELIYTIFNFDKNYKLADKVDFIKNYYLENDFIQNLFTNILWAFCLLIMTYFLINISRLIINLSEKQLTPWIYKITDSKSIVLKETYDALKNENNHLELQLEKERDSKGRLQKEVSNLENRLEEMFVEQTEFSNDKIEEKEKEKQTDAEILANKVENKKLIDKLFTIIIPSGDDNGWLDTKDEEYQYLVKLGLTKTKQTSGKWVKYELTEIGQKVLNILRLKID